MVSILRLSDVVRATTLSKTTIWRLEQAGRFPRRVALSGNRVGWRQNEVEEWLASRGGSMGKKRGNSQKPKGAAGG